MNSRKRRARTGEAGKLGIVRLSGPLLTRLRLDCYIRAKGRCEKCGERLYYQARYPGDPLAFDMAHIKSRGAGGSDVLENVQCLCHKDHMNAHAGKP